MEGMFARVHVVEDYLNYLIFLEDVGIGVFAIDFCIAGGYTCGENAIKGGDFRADVGYVVEKGTWTKSIE